MFSKNYKKSNIGDVDWHFRSNSSKSDSCYSDKWKSDSCYSDSCTFGIWNLSHHSDSSTVVTLTVVNLAFLNLIAFSLTDEILIVVLNLTVTDRSDSCKCERLRTVVNMAFVYLIVVTLTDL